MRKVFGFSMVLMASACLTSCNLISGLMSDKDSESDSENVTVTESVADEESGAGTTNSFYADGRVVRITGTYLRMRLGPSVDFDMLKDDMGETVYLDKGDCYDCYGEQSDFYRIRYNGQFVYVSKQFSEIVGRESNSFNNSDSYTSSSSSSSSDWDSILDEYEELVLAYIKLAQKAQQGDLSAITQYVSILEKSQSVAKKLDGSKADLSPAQLERYAKINLKMMEAAQSLQ